MTFRIIQGDLFDLSHNFDALAQGVNTKGIMGSGIAVDFKDRWPTMFSDYEYLCSKYPDILSGLMHSWLNPYWSDEDPIQMVFNLFSQDFPGRDNAVLEYVAKSALLMRMDAEGCGLERVGLPWIGCGVGGLEKHNVGHLFDRILGPSKVEFVLVERP
jgi:O-acetyl-ADP-ribose deacetylase (regulator of RNase III)